MPNRDLPSITVAADRAPFAHEAEAIEAEVRQRAFEIFQRRDAMSDDVRDWLQAEAETVYKPACEIVETEDGYVFEFAVPGLEAKNIEIVLSSACLLVRGSRAPARTAEGRVLHSEYRASRIHREVPLPEGCEHAKAKAHVARGVLAVTVPRKRQEARGAKAVKAAKAPASASGAASAAPKLSRSPAKKSR
ncbi:MAG: Hsp20/alpha crystallin family protein [Planctomycetes bacterium]|nr:Hsp20/alpha crystallin family protein [Planctomycetota bacterium]